MKKLFLFLAISVSLVVYAADKGTWTGFISDDHCGAKSGNEGHAACAKKCVKAGHKPVLVVGDKMYTLNNPDKVANFIGDKVTIEGNMTGDAIDIEKVTKEKTEKAVTTAEKHSH